jgi:hypothetical protein
MTSIIAEEAVVDTGADATVQKMKASKRKTKVEKGAEGMGSKRKKKGGGSSRRSARKTRQKKRKVVEGAQVVDGEEKKIAE